VLTTEPTPESSHLFGKQLVRKLVLPVVFAVVVYAALLFYGDASAIFAGLRELTLSAVGWALLVSAASFAVRALRWHFYLITMKIRVPLADSVTLFLAGLAMSITPGKAGELLKSLLLKERYDVPVARSGPIIFAERLTDLGALLLLAGASALWTSGPLLVVAIALLFIGALFAFGRSEFLGKLAIDIVCVVPFVRRRRDKLTIAHGSLRELWSARSFVIAMVLSIGAWSLQALTVTLLADGMHQHGLSVPEALIAFSAPLLAGTLALLPGGLGLTEASMAGTLRALAEMSATAAAAITILTRLVTFWFAIVLGFAGLGAWRLTRPNAVRYTADAVDR
jgi:glycosyltransferase 2 family protein